MKGIITNYEKDSLRFGVFVSAHFPFCVFFDARPRGRWLAP